MVWMKWYVLDEMVWFGRRGTVWMMWYVLDKVVLLVFSGIFGEVDSLAKVVWFC
jgi:hypothetical protein